MSVVFKGTDYKEVVAGRNARELDLSVRKSLGLKPAGVRYFGTDWVKKPIEIFKDSKGQEYIRRNPGEYEPLDGVYYV